MIESRPIDWLDQILASDDLVDIMSCARACKVAITDELKERDDQIIALLARLAEAEGICEAVSWLALRYGMVAGSNYRAACEHLKAVLLAHIARLAEAEGLMGELLKNSNLPLLCPWCGERQSQHADTCPAVRARAYLKKHGLEDK